MQDEFKAALASQLHDVVDFGDEIPERYHRDWSGLSPVRPVALIRPRTTADVSQAARLCHAHHVPIVPQGGLTGLAGGAQPLAEGVALSLDRMNRIEEVDAVMATMTVEAGVTLGAAQAAAEAHDLLLGLDLGARDSCQIGGNLSTNAGGNRVVRYGMARDHVLGLEVVLADGTVVTALNKLIKNNAGYDLKQMFLGAEGTLGIITRAVLKLQARPRVVLTGFCGCPNFDAVSALLQQARRGLGPSLTAFEAMWPSFYDRMTRGLPDLRRPFNDDHGCYVLIEASLYGEGETHNPLEALLEQALEAGIVSDAVLATSEREARELWAVRESVTQYDRVIGPNVAYDIGLPTPLIGTFVDDIERAIMARWPDALPNSYGHVGDSNLHLVVAVPSAGRDQPMQELSGMVYDAVGSLGGTISAEHGIGLLKRPYLSRSRTVEELALMRRVKQALDPLDIMNRGKILEH